MPRKHVNLKIESHQFQLSVLDPFFHRSYNQAWTPTERAPNLIAGDQWLETDLPRNFTRAMDQAVLTCTSLARKITTGTYPKVTSIIVHISRNDVTFMLKTQEQTQSAVMLQYTWDKNVQLVEPNNYSELATLGLSVECQQTLREDLTQSSFGRLGLVARCLRLMAQKPQKPQDNQARLPTGQMA